MRARASRPRWGPIRSPIPTRSPMTPTACRSPRTAGAGRCRRHRGQRGGAAARDAAHSRDAAGCRHAGSRARPCRRRAPARPLAGEDRSLMATTVHAGQARPARPAPDPAGGGQPEGYDEVEASKAPLMDHLIELRQRLIYALIGIGIGFAACFAFATRIYTILVWPYLWAQGGDKVKMIFTAPQEFFFTKLKLALFAAVFLAFPLIAYQIYMFVAPGLYKNERQAFRPFLVAAFLLFLSRRADRLFHRHAADDEVLPGDADHRGDGRDRAAGQGERVPVADHDADPGLRHHVPAARGAHPAGAGGHHRRPAAARSSAATPSSPSPASPRCSPRPTPSA